MPSAAARLLGEGRLRLLLALDEVGVGGALGLLVLALGAGQLLGELGDFACRFAWFASWVARISASSFSASSPPPCAR